MKYIFTISIFLFFSISSFSQVRDNVDMIMEIFKTEKKAMVQDYMDLSDK